ncbi:hypothetical protein AKJ39_03890 [candidate division MSBL1 archaeon SCGC-AAA259J03]|uniref:ABC transporter domain-containing protein n=1 Tax=candidate division MSBL1 archaeon SCGC-AAA259J03 TaxID=1698269 RepID=A0A656YY47_9EURY|nr:hypothetical protein AKJ39_03890 [candidate division MSBL1 archaeon SCGC-AAA259J03]
MLEIKNMSTGYGDVPVIDDITMEVEKNQTVGLIGSNGAGKSTLLNTIVGILKPWSGNIEYEGNTINKISPESRVSRGITLVPERRELFPLMSVEENLEVGSCVNRKNVEEEFERVYKLFPILKDRKRQKAKSLSGGEAQMLAIARGLMSGPKLFMLDEPSLGLAPKIIKKVEGVIQEIKEAGETSILLSDQSSSLVLKLSDYVYILEEGSIAFQGTEEEILSKDVIKDSYFGQEKRL